MAVPIGLVGALRPRSFSDRFLTVCAQVAIATPVFWLAPILSYVFAFEPNQGTFLGYLARDERQRVPDRGLGVTDHPTLASGCTTCCCPGSRWLWVSPASMRVSSARSCSSSSMRTTSAPPGPKEPAAAQVLRAHVGRVVAPSIITLLGLDLGAAIGGVLFVELVFGLPGLGFVAVNSIENLDYPVTVGVVTFTGLLTVAAMTLSDLAVAALDPRVRRPLQ